MSQNTLSLMGRSALKYARVYDFAVLPLEVAKIGEDGKVRCSCRDGARCEQGIGKHPIGSLAPEGFKNATRDEAEIRRIWTARPDASIGIRTGSKKSGGSGIVVIDVDDKAGKEGSYELDILQDHIGRLPDTWRAKTGSGWHLFFRYNEDSPLRVGNRQGILLPGSSKRDKLRSLDVRGENGYVVGAPSPHYSGRTYNWVDGAPSEFPIADMPQALLELLGRDPEAKPDAAIMPEGDWGPVKKRLKLARVYLQKMDASVSGQGGHNALFRAAFFLLRGFVLPTDVVYDVLMEDFNPRCLPPWKHSDIVHKIEQAVTNCDQPWGFALENVERTRQEKEAEKLRQLLEQTRPKPRSQPKSDDVSMATDGANALDVADGSSPPASPATPAGLPLPKRQRVFLRGDHVELADALRDVFDEEASPLMWDEGCYHKYMPEKGIWEPVEIEVVKRAVGDFAGNPILGSRKVVNIRSADASGAEMFLRCSMIAEKRWSFTNRWQGIAYRNGFAELIGDKIVLSPHQPEQMSKHVFDFDYVEGLPHPDLDSFFEAVFGDVPDEKDRADRVSLLQEFIGTSLVGQATRYQRCLILTGKGKGGNGKSQLLDIFRSIFPPGTTAALPPQHWGEHFQQKNLIGKLANLVDELPKDGISNTSRFKGIISGDIQHCDIKGKDPIEFRPVAGHILSCNDLFHSDDQTAGFWRRQLIVPMTRDMSKMAGGVTIDVGKKIGEKERAAISAWALEGACRVAKQGGYTVPRSSQKAVEDWRTDNDPIRKFLMDPMHFSLLTSPSGWKAAEMFESFKIWASTRNFGMLNETNFGKRILLSGIADKQRKSSGYFYKLNQAGLSLLEEEKKEAEHEEKIDAEKAQAEAFRKAEESPPPPPPPAPEPTPPPAPPAPPSKQETAVEVQSDLPLSYEETVESATWEGMEPVPPSYEAPYDDYVPPTDEEEGGGGADDDGGDAPG